MNSIRHTAGAGINSELKFFARGIFRIAIWTAATMLVLLTFNIIGFLASTYNLIYWVDAYYLPHPNSYWGRVSLLILVGIIEVTISVGLVVFAAISLWACYIGILRFGGYGKGK